MSDTPTIITPTQGLLAPSSKLAGQQQVTERMKENLTRFISPVQLERIKQDVRLWREAIGEAEFAYYPQRVKMQRLFLDTDLNGHVEACVGKRQDLTLLREFMICDKNEKEIPDLTAMFDVEWFDEYMSLSLDADDFGYSLISLGSIVDDGFPNIVPVKRWHVSPDRFNVTSYIYGNQGVDFRDPKVADWHVYISTANKHGISPCGYGRYYKIGIYEIFLRNLLGFNGDFVEKYAMPFMVAKTNKTNEDERGQLERELKMAGSNSFAIVDPTDELSFLEAKLAGTGWNGYDNLEQRLEKKISKILLGHADAMDSTPGKLGGGQDGEQSPAALALSDKKTRDGKRIERNVNQELLPRMRRLGFDIPEGVYFKFKNDDESNDRRVNEDKNNLATATLAKTMKEAGLEMEQAYFTQRTGIPAVKIEPAKVEESEELETAQTKKMQVAARIKNKLDKLYS